MHGAFLNDKAVIPIEVRGSQGVVRRLNGIVDSGFTGDLQIPIGEAFTLGLILLEIEELTLADGSIMPRIICLGEVSVDDVSVSVKIAVVPVNIVLIGTKLLKKLGKTFILNCEMGQVELVDYAA